MNNNSEIFNTVIDIKPCGLMYQLRGETIESFVYDYLTKKNITGVESVVARVKREGNISPEMNIYLFMNPNSPFLKSSARNVPASLRSKLDSITIDATDGLKTALFPLCGNQLTIGTKDSSAVYIRLNIFRVLGLMLAAEIHKHRIIVTDVTKIPQERDCVVSVMKHTVYTPRDNNNNSESRYIRLADEIDR